MIKRIALSGKMCSGKSTIAHYLVKRHGFTHLTFAHRVKLIAQDLFDSKTKDRQLLQQIGMRMREIDAQVWVRYVLKEIPGDANCVISDVRFENEAKSLRGMGFVLVRLEIEPTLQLERITKLYGDIDASALNHVSERALDNFEFDYCVDGSLKKKDVLEVVETILLTMELNNDNGD